MREERAHTEYDPWPQWSSSRNQRSGKIKRRKGERKGERKREMKGMRGRKKSRERRTATPLTFPAILPTCSPGAAPLPVLVFVCSLSCGPILTFCCILKDLYHSVYCYACSQIVGSFEKWLILVQVRENARWDRSQRVRKGVREKKGEKKERLILDQRDRGRYLK